MSIVSNHVIDTKGDGFMLSFEIEFFEKDIQYPENTILSVSVRSGEYFGSTTMDIDMKQFALFTIDLKNIYDTLIGNTKITEPYGCQKYISFSANKSGHIFVEGFLCDDMSSHELRFKNGFDQTFLKDFSRELFSMYSKYAPNSK